MRLIDSENINLLLKNMVEKETGAFTKGYNKALKDIKSMINNSEQCPTAYDIDKVVEELEKLADENYKAYCIAFNSDDRAEYDAYTNAIEIVKQGGVSDDVCEWRLCDEEANVYDTSCRNPHILIKGTPKENNYEYCPYCGKKIKESD